MQSIEIKTAGRKVRVELYDYRNGDVLTGDGWQLISETPLRSSGRCVSAIKRTAADYPAGTVFAVTEPQYRMNYVYVRFPKPVARNRNSITWDK